MNKSWVLAIVVVAALPAGCDRGSGRDYDLGDLDLDKYATFGEQEKLAFSYRELAGQDYSNLDGGLPVDYAETSGHPAYLMVLALDVGQDIALVFESEDPAVFEVLGSGCGELTCEAEGCTGSDPTCAHPGAFDYVELGPRSVGAARLIARTADGTELDAATVTVTPAAGAAR
jgi:hypothetical protein